MACISISGIDMIVSIVAVLKAEAAYVPLPPDYPDEHLGMVVDDAQPRLIISAQSSLVLACKKTWSKSSTFANVLGFFTCAAEQGGVDFCSSNSGGRQTPFAQDVAARLAYVIYTSGSEGRPKGVVVTMRNLMCSTAARESFYGERVKRFLLTSSFAFDSSIVGIFWTLNCGGTLVLPAKRIEQDMHRFSTVLHEERITHVLLLPTVYQLLLRHGDTDKLDTLETVIVAGESCPWQLVEQHRTTGMAIRLVNE